MEDRGHKLQDGPVEPWKMPIQVCTSEYLVRQHTIYTIYRFTTQCRHVVYIPQCTMEIVAIVKTIRLTH